MRPEVLERLAHTLTTLAECGPEGMTVEALWQGEKANSEKTVSIQEFAALARASQLSTHTRYVVSRRSA